MSFAEKKKIIINAGADLVGSANPGFDTYWRISDAANSFIPTLGTGALNRIGQKIFVKSIIHKIMVTPTIGTILTAGTFAGGYMRIV